MNITVKRTKSATAVFSAQAFALVFVFAHEQPVLRLQGRPGPARAPAIDSDPICITIGATRRQGPKRSNQSFVRFPACQSFEWIHASREHCELVNAVFHATMDLRAAYNVTVATSSAPYPTYIATTATRSFRCWISDIPIDET